MYRRTARNRQLDIAESVSFLNALRHHTMDGAFAAFDEDELGSLAPGKQADFVIWRGNLENVRTSEDLVPFEPEATYLAGKPVYQA